MFSLRWSGVSQGHRVGTTEPQVIVFNVSVKKYEDRPFFIVPS